MKSREIAGVTICALRETLYVAALFLVSSVPCQAQNSHDLDLGSSLGGAGVTQARAQEEEGQAGNLTGAGSLSQPSGVPQQSTFSLPVSENSGSAPQTTEVNKLEVTSTNEVLGGIEAKDGGVVAIGDTELAKVNAESVTVNTKNKITGDIEAGSGETYKVGNVNLKEYQGQKVNISTDNTLNHKVTTKQKGSLSLGNVNLGGEEEPGGRIQNRNFSDGSTRSNVSISTNGSTNLGGASRRDRAIPNQSSLESPTLPKELVANEEVNPLTGQGSLSPIVNGDIDAGNVNVKDYVADLLSKYQNVVGTGNALAQYIVRADNSLRTLKSINVFNQEFYKFYNSFYDEETLSSFRKIFSLIDELDKKDTELADKLFTSFLQNDGNKLVEILETAKRAESVGQKVTKILTILDKFGKYVLVPLTVTTESAEIFAKYKTGTATGEDYAKAAVNSGVAVAGIVVAGSTSVIAVGVGASFGSIQAGAKIAELIEGESFSDSQQRYMDVVYSINNELTQFDHNQIAHYYKGGLATDIAGRADLARQIIGGKIILLEGISEELNSKTNRLASGFNFESKKRDQIAQAVMVLRDDLASKYSQSNEIATNQYRAGRSLLETQMRREILIKVQAEDKKEKEKIDISRL